jgi:hypothetical protein
VSSTTRRGAAANEQLESEDNMFDSTCFKPMIENVPHLHKSMRQEPFWLHKKRSSCRQ